MINSLEGLRGLAALMVAVYHLKLEGSYFPFIKHGYLFVDLFFVLSGFVIAGAYGDKLGKRTKFSSFMVRRWGRLFPLMVVSTVLFVLAQKAFFVAKAQAIASGLGAALRNPEQLEYLWPTWAEIAATLTFTHAMGLFDRLILSRVSWSISVEFWAYVLFGALCVTLTRRRRIGASVVLAAVAYAITLWASTGTSHQCLEEGKCLDLTYDYGFTRCVSSFLLGTLLWEVRDCARRWEAPVQIVSLGALSVLFAAAEHAPALAFLAPFFFCTLVWSLAKDTGPAARLLSGRIGVALGRCSYSTYMLHPVLLVVILPVVARVNSIWGALAVTAFYLVALVVISRWMFRWVEEPGRRYVNGIADRWDMTRIAARQAPDATQSP